MKESRPLGGHMPVVPPGSTNAYEEAEEEIPPLEDIDA